MDLSSLLDGVRSLMLHDSRLGSDPGLCVAHTIPAVVSAFRGRTQREMVSQT
jgi:hypothetical protein